MQIRKKCLKKFKNFLTNTFKNIIWHLFAGAGAPDIWISFAMIFVELEQFSPKKL
jgi:hypothetical protein